MGRNDKGVIFFVHIVSVTFIDTFRHLRIGENKAVVFSGNSLESGNGHISVEQHCSRDLGTHSGDFAGRTVETPEDCFMVTSGENGQRIPRRQSIDTVLDRFERGSNSSFVLIIAMRGNEKLFSPKQRTAQNNRK